jgi:hypothetical protein
MSSRFGRNKRRRMRQEIEALQNKTNEGLKAKEQLMEAIQMTQGLVDHFRDRLNRAEDQISLAKNIIGEDFIAFAPTKIRTSLESDDAVRLRNFRMAVDHPFEFSAPSKICGMEAHTFEAVPLHFLLAKIKTDRLRRMKHAQAELLGKEVIYSISEDAIRGMPERELARRLSEQLSLSLAKLLKG